MLRLWMILPVLCAGCMTSALWERSSGRPRERLLGDLSIPMRPPVELSFADRPSVAYPFDAPTAAMPPRLREDVGKGYLWLRLEKPLTAACFDLDLLAGRTPWQPASVTFRLERTIRSNRHLESAPMSVAVRGSQSLAELGRWLDLEVEPRTMSEDQPGAEMAAALDALVDGATGGNDGAIWIGVVDGAGREIGDWRKAVERARKRRSLAPVEGLYVIAKRLAPPHSLIRIRLGAVLLANRMRITRDVKGDGFHWVWRTEWWGRLIPDAVAGTQHELDVDYLVTLRYRELKRIHPYGAGGLAWRIALTPFAAAADATLLAGIAYAGATEAEIELE